jgi:hypothetical protein
MSNLNSDNAYRGGITYATPSFIFGGQGSINGGYAFDLPLATVAAFNNQGLSYLQENSQNARGFFTANQEATSNALARTENASIRLATSGFNSIRDVVRASIASNERMNWHNQIEATNRTALLPKPDSGFCFITTAICEIDGLPDDCEELTILRRFRDSFMMADEHKRELVVQYYNIAPDVVKALKKLPDNGKFSFGVLKDNYLLPAIEMVKSGDNEGALKTYTAMVDCALEMSKG